MTTFLVHLLIASLVGTGLWITQNIMKPITEKFFSRTWDYYTALIPVCFLLGGTEICIRLFSFVRFFLQQPGAAMGVERLGEGQVTGAFAGTPGKGNLLIDQLLDHSSRFAYLNEILIGLVVTWAIGFTVFFGSHIHMYRSYKRSLLQGSRVYRNDIFPVKVRICPQTTTPLLIGFWKPILLLPQVELSEQELAMILAHERVHLKRGDLLVKVLVLVANAVHWFNPVIYRLAKQINAQCELSCDEQVVRGMDEESRRRYGEVLLAMLEYSVKHRDIAFTTPLYSSKSEIKRRLVNLMKEKKSKKSALLVSLLSAFVWISGGAAAAYAAGASVPSDLSPRKQTFASPVPTGQQTEGREQAKLQVTASETNLNKNRLIMTKELLSIAQLGKLDGIELPLGATKEDILNTLGEPDQQGEDNAVFYKYGKSTFYLVEDILIGIAVEHDFSVAKVKSILGTPDLDGMSDAGVTEYVVGYETGSYYLYFTYPSEGATTGKLLFKNPR